MSSVDDAESEVNRRQKSITINAIKPYIYPLLNNIHLALTPTHDGQSLLLQGNITYFHYGCDGFKDHGWGCAYRTLQTMCSWIIDKRKIQHIKNIPSIRDIQRILVNIGDKPKQFIGSRDWIGAIEVFYVVDNLFDVSCKILHIMQNEHLQKYANVIKEYFEDFAGLVMMGGDKDAASKAIAGIHITESSTYLLIIDPHFSGVPNNAQELIDRGYIRWQLTSDFVDSSFYNLCFPQLK